jgi:hypothetical protein
MKLLKKSNIYLSCNKSYYNLNIIIINFILKKTMIKIGAKNQSDKIIFEDSGSATLLAQLIPAGVARALYSVHNCSAYSSDR